MSGKVVGWAMEQVTGSPAAKLVLVKLADNASDDGLAWPSVEVIKDHTEQGQSTVYRCLAKLQEMGLIERTTIIVHPGSGNEYSCEGWQLAVPAEWRLPAAGKRSPAAGTNGPARGKAIPAPRKAIPAAGVPYKEEPSSEPSLNLAPDAARALEGRGAGLGGDASEATPPSAQSDRMALLARMFDPATFEAWFVNCYFREGEGASLTLVLDGAMHCNRVRDKYGDRLRRAFGDHLAFDCQRVRTRSGPDA